MVSTFDSRILIPLCCSIFGYKFIKGEKGILKSRQLKTIQGIINEKYCSNNSNRIQKFNKTHDLIQQSIRNEIKLARRNILIGICALSTGIISVIWYSTMILIPVQLIRTPYLDHFLIHVIIVMEVTLLPLLYFIFESAREKFTKATKMKSFAKNYKDPRNERLEEDDSWLTLDTFTFIHDSSISWDEWRTFKTLKKIYDPTKLKLKIAFSVVIGEKTFMEDIELMEDKVNSLRVQTGATIMTSRRENCLLKQAAWSTLEGCGGCVLFLCTCIPFHCFLITIQKFNFNEEKDKPLDISRGLLWSFIATPMITILCF